MSIRVLVADDSAIVRRAICQTLEDHAEIQVVGESTDFASTVLRANELKPEVIVLDLHMPDDNTVVSSFFRSVLTNNCRIIAVRSRAMPRLKSWRRASKPTSC
jgi:chemotaxis response regulator CheB